jgi:predicted DNA-binding transcriptional regulator AlpA
MTDFCMRTPEAAHYLGISESTLNKTRLTGDGPPFVKVMPRAVAYRKPDLDAWLEARLCQSTSDNPMAA